MNLFKKFSKNEKGATAIEYALIAALLGVVLIGGLTTLGGNLSGLFTAIGGVAETATSNIPAGAGAPPAE